MEATLCWNNLIGAGSGFGWDRRDGRPLRNLPRIPGPTQNELKIRSLMTVAFDQSGMPVGRFFLLNGRKGNQPFNKADLAWPAVIQRELVKRSVAASDIESVGMGSKRPLVTSSGILFFLSNIICDFSSFSEIDVGVAMFLHWINPKVRAC